MLLIICNNPEEVGKRAAGLVVETLSAQPASVFGFTADSEAFATYAELAKDRQINNTNWSRVTTFNLGEYVGIRGTDPISRRYTMDARLFTRINIDQDNTHFPNAIGDLVNEPFHYEQMIKKAGGIDLQLVELGASGSVGFNFPGSKFDSRTRIMDLPDATVEQLSRQFSKRRGMPKRAIAMGMETIREARRIIMIASGAEKADTVLGLLEGDVSDDLPSTMLRSHADITLLADKPAAKKLKLKLGERLMKRATYNF